jgi:anti-sigma B factor antagonist
MAIRIREAGAITILDIDGNIDINSSEIIETVGWLVKSGKLQILINLENVNLVDYSGLSILAISYKNVLNHEGKMKFLHPPASIIELFKLAKLDSVFETFSDEEAAVQSFGTVQTDGLLLRRRFKRLEIHLGVKYRSAVKGERRSKAHEGRTLTIGAGGIYIHTPNTFAVDTPLELEIKFPAPYKPLEAKGKVVWVAEKKLQPHHYPGMGVAFVHLSQEKEEMIVDFIDKNITHRSEDS